jgi:hypothetical protein
MNAQKRHVIIRQGGARMGMLRVVRSAAKQVGAGTYVGARRMHLWIGGDIGALSFTLAYTSSSAHDCVYRPGSS